MQSRHIDKCRPFKRARSPLCLHGSGHSMYSVSYTWCTCSWWPRGSWLPLGTPRCVSPHRSSPRYRPSAPSHHSRRRQDPVTTPRNPDGKGWMRDRPFEATQGICGCLLPRGSTVLHIWWWRRARWGRSSPPGCWCWSAGNRSCSRAPPSSLPALLPWQPAAFSAGCSTEACRRRGRGLASDTSDCKKKAGLAKRRHFLSANCQL